LGEAQGNVLCSKPIYVAQIKSSRLRGSLGDDNKFVGCHCHAEAERHRHSSLAGLYRSPFGIIATIIGIVLGAIQIMAIVQGRSSGSSTPAIMLPLILVFLLPLGVAFGGLFGAAVSKWLTDVRYSFDDAGFRASVPDVTARFAWTEVKASLQTGKYVVLSLPSALHILPVARLESGVERELRDLVRNKVTPSPKK